VERGKGRQHGSAAEQAIARDILTFIVVAVTDPTVIKTETGSIVSSWETVVRGQNAEKEGRTPGGWEVHGSLSPKVAGCSTNIGRLMTLKP
jgi:hypothetical protein